MRVTLFGTRGSLATPGVATSRYGGNTSDAQYTMRNMPSVLGGGTAPTDQAAEFAAQIGAKVFVPFHHDRSHTNDTLDQLLATAKQQLKSACQVCAGYESATFEVGA